MVEALKRLDFLVQLVELEGGLHYGCLAHTHYMYIIS